MKKILFLLSIVAFSSYANAGSTAFNGSCTSSADCTDGLYCDMKICIKSSQQACSLSNPCAIGQSCFSIDSSTNGASSTIVTGTTVGVCGNSVSGVNNNAFQQAFCSMYNFVTGSVGKGVAVCAVVAIGVFFFLGKVTWGSVAAVAIGIGAMFGAPAVVGVLTGSSMSCKASS